MKDEFASTVDILEIQMRLAEMDKRLAKILDSCIHLASLVEDLYVISRPLRGEVSE